MWKCRGLIVVCLIIVKLVRTENEVMDFMAINRLDDGEIETRIFYKGIYAKQISVAGDKRLSDKVTFRQIAHKHSLLQLIFNGDALKDCDIVHGKHSAQQFLTQFRRELKHLAANVTVVPLDGLPDDVAHWMDVKVTRRECRKVHREVEVAVRRRNATTRHRRDISDLLRVPGTKWCGKGYSADKYTRLGGFSKTDKCCRRHDLSCRWWIGAFETKYGLFNWRINTIMHCSCDERFRACLKMVDTGDANLVGKLFFNVVQSKCFVIKPRKVCVKYSWWGQCEKFRHEKQAILRDNLPY